MNTNWKIEGFDNSSKIWVYTIHPNLTEEQEKNLEAELSEFCKTWTAHNKELKAFFKIIQHTILILGVDEHLNPASGCSIDKSVHFLEELELKYSLNFFNRMLFTYIEENGTFVTKNKQEFEELLSKESIHSKTNVVNTLTLTLQEWNEKGIQTIENSWMKSFFNIPV